MASSEHAHVACVPLCSATAQAGDHLRDDVPRLPSVLHLTVLHMYALTHFMFVHLRPGPGLPMSGVL